MAAGPRIYAALAAGTLAAGLVAALLSAGGSPRAAAPAPDIDPFAEIAALSRPEEFERPEGPWRLSLPRDMGGHGDARAETWAIAAQLRGEDGAPVGLQVSLTRFGLRAPPAARLAGDWELRALHRGHVAVTGAGADGRLGEERFSRGGGVAGHDAEARSVWLDQWRIDYGEGPQEDRIAVNASAEGVPVRLELTPLKPALAANEGGAGPLRGFAMTRMRAEGEIGAGAAAMRVSGLAWLDRAWGELPLPGGPLARDRLQLQMGDGSELSLVRSRRRDGRGAASVDGFVVDGAGAARALEEGAVEMEPVDHWSPPGSESAYPVGWRVSGAGFDLKVAPLAEDQRRDFALPGWSGAVRAEGTRDGADVTGRGMLDLTGYEGG